MVNDRDCENCKHYKKEVCKDGIFYYSCELWDCEFEPKEDEPFEPCEDCISRQAVLDLLVKYDNDMKFDVYSEIFDNIDKLPPVNPKQSWIPVSERLPEDSGNYLIAIADSNYTNGQYFKISWFYPSDKEWSYRNAAVIAWMPLPEPYKAESEKKE